MPEWSKEILLALIAAVTGGIAWWFKSAREDRIRRETAQQAIVDKLQKRYDDLQAKLESLLMDAKAKAEEDHAERAERLAMEKQWAALVTAMTVALERSEATNVRLLLKDGR